MTDNVQAIKPVSPKMGGGFVETESSAAMMRALRRARAQLKITMIAGAPGVGKTETLFRFRQETPDAVFHTATAEEGGARNLALALCKSLDLPRPNLRDLAQTRQEIAEAIDGEGFLMIDEAQYLCQRNHRGSDNWEALEWLRRMAEDGSFALVICGDLRLLDALRNAPQLARRTHPRVVLSCSTPNDVRTFCNGRGFTDPKEIGRLSRLAKRYGGIGDVAEVLTTASAMSGGCVPNASDVRAAIEFLGFKRGAHNA